MQYRQLGKTGLQVSEIGLGCEHLDNRPYEEVAQTISAALDVGVNVLDVFMPGEPVRQNIARALGNRRKDVVIQGHIGSTDIKQQYDISRDKTVYPRYFEQLLRIFGGYIDLGMMFFIDTQADYDAVFETDFAEYAVKLKQQGDIGHIGFSSHNPAIAMQTILTGVPDTMMFSINPAFDMLPASEYVFDHTEQKFGGELFRGIDPQRAELYKLCEQKQVGITVMKTFGGGKLLSSEHSPFSPPLTAVQCIAYALSRPAVSSVLLGCKTAEEVQKALQYYAASENERDYSAILSGMRNDFAGNCVYCGHCQPCPMGIDISTVNKYLDIALLDMQNVPPSLRTHYNHLAHTGAECIECGACELRCPFGVSIIQNMARAQEVLG